MNPTDSSDLNDSNSGEDIRELENLITGMHYRHKMDVNHLLYYPDENNECYEIQSIEEIVADAIQNPVNDEVEDDSIVLEPVTRKKYCKRQQLFTTFVVVREDNAQTL